MTSPSAYPFSDLTAEQVQELIARRPNGARPGHTELFRQHSSAGGAKPGLAGRQREAQVWPPKNVPALSLTVYR